jgi:hypothetical protein
MSTIDFDVERVKGFSTMGFRAEMSAKGAGFPLGLRVEMSTKAGSVNKGWKVALLFLTMKWRFERRVFTLGRGPGQDQPACAL